MPSFRDAACESPRGLKEASDDVIADYKTNGKRSLAEVTRKFRLHVIPHFGERRRMVSITTAHIRALIAARQDAGAAAAKINRELAALRRAFRLALQAGRLVQIPHVPMLQDRNTRKGFLESDQMEIDTILTGQLAEHERLKAAGTVCPFVFHRNGKRIREFRTAWENACRPPGVRAS